MENLETIAAISTPPGRGGVAVVRVSGPAAFAVATCLTGRPVDASLAGRFFHAVFKAKGLPLDDGLVLVFATPRSYTGEDVVEFQCHGGSVAPRRVLEACLSAGARLARRGEFTQRAFLNGRLDLSAAEAVIDLIDAKTDRAADDAVARLGGAASAAFAALYATALDLSSRVEHALDFSEDELPPDFKENLVRDIAALRMRIAARIATAREGRLLREGALVVLAGPPNAGKSSLLNALLGERRAIVSSAAGTTRDSIEEGVEIGGWPVRLVDTAGLRATADAVEAEGVDRAEALIAQADLVLALQEAEAGGRATKTPRTTKTTRISRTIHVLTKCDLANHSPISSAQPIQNASLGSEARPVLGVLGVVGVLAPGSPLPVSALTGEGLPELRAEIAARLERLAAKGCEASGADVTTRQKEQLEIAAGALARADTGDLVVAANELRVAADALGRMIGKVYSDDLLDSIFSRFCVGK